MTKPLPILVLLAACATASPANVEQALRLAAADDSLRTLVDAFADSSRAPSLSIAIARDDRVIFAYARGASASIHTQYRIGSVSKLLTATAAVRLAARHHLDLDAEIHQYVPEFPPKPYPITLRQLAGHLSGIRHYARSEFVNRTHYDSVAPTIGIFSGDSLLFVPGSRYGYSSYGYNLLSLAVERAAGAPFLQVVSREVLGPLRLRETAPDRPDSAMPRRANPFELSSDGRLVPATVDDLSNRWASGGFVASVMDLAHFAAAFLHPGFLSDSLIRMMTTPQRLTSGENTAVGFGWRIGKDGAGRTIWHHAGSSVGGRAVLVVWPDEHLVVAIAGNLLFDMSERTTFRFADMARAQQR